MKHLTGHEVCTDGAAWPLYTSRCREGRRRRHEDGVSELEVQYARSWFRKWKVHCGSLRETKAEFDRRAGGIVYTLVDEDFENWR